MNTRKAIFTLYVWTSFFVLSIFILSFSAIANLSNEHNFSDILEYLTYFFAFGFSSILFFRALVYSLRFSVDRLSMASSAKERIEDAEFRLVVEILLIFLTISINVIFILLNHLVLIGTAGRNSDVYSILVNILGVSIFSFVCFMWPTIGRIEETIIKRLIK